MTVLYYLSTAPDPATTGPDPTTTTDRVVGSTTNPGGRIITAPPVTTPDPSGTTPVTTPAQDDRLVVINTGNSANPLIIIDDQNSNNNNNNAGLLLLLALLPVLGALGQTAGTASAAGAFPLGGPVAPVGGAVAPMVAPSSPSAFWNSGFGASRPFMSDFSLGNSFGYGSFGGTHAGSFDKKGSYYGNKKSNYGRGNEWVSNIVSTAGNYPLASGIGNFQYDQNNGNGQFAPSSFSTVNSLNTIGSNNFVVKSETFVQNGISRQPLNPAFAGSNGILGQQNQYQTGQQHDYTTGLQNQQNEYSNNHVNSYTNQFPATKSQVLPNTRNTISSWQNNGRNNLGSSGWSNGNQNGFDNIRKNGFMNGNNNFGNVNTNGWTNTQANFFTNNFDNKVNNFGINGLTNNGNWNNAGNQLSGYTGTGTSRKAGFTRISHPQGTSNLWQQGTAQPTGTGFKARPQINDLYSQLFGGFSQHQGTGNLGAGGFLQTPPVRSL